jgi:outer membrane protein OmpA-like peptidoglycan-associated protein
MTHASHQSTHHPARAPLAALGLAALAAISACSSLPQPNANLDAARAILRSAQADPQTQGLAGPELQNASTALALADAAQARGESSASVDHLAYLASQRSVLLQQAGQRRSAEAILAQAGGQRDQQRLAARTQEADTANRSAQAAQRDAQDALRTADAAQRDARIAQRQAGASQLQAGEAERRADALAQQLATLDARQTDRGLVVTIGDVLFDTDQAQLKPGGQRSMDKLVRFLQAYPQRRALIEGFTDSTGGSAHNQALSARRAEAVRAALVAAGVGAQRLSAMGLGEAYPVAGNGDAGGRQMNRRVEILLSDEAGQLRPR